MVVSLQRLYIFISKVRHRLDCLRGGLKKQFLVGSHDPPIPYISLPPNNTKDLDLGLVHAGVEPSFIVVAGVRFRNGHPF